MSSADVRICETFGCNANAPFQCPTCIKLGIPGSFFCSQVGLHLLGVNKVRLCLVYRNVSKEAGKNIKPFIRLRVC